MIRRKGAEGTLPVPAEDKIEILAFLAGAPDTDLRDKARQTLRQVNGVEIRRVMANPQTAPDVLCFAAEHLLEARPELKEILLWNPSLPVGIRDSLQPKPVPKTPHIETEAEPASPAPETLPQAGARAAAEELPSQPASALPRPAEKGTIEILAKLAAGSPLDASDLKAATADVEAPPEATMPDDELTQKDRETLIQKINRMSIVERIKAALTGNMETRSLLIRDANRIVARAVLQSPKISETEAEGYAAAKNVSEEVLRLIAMNRKFMKAYVVMRALINNPRAPIDITMPLLLRLNDRDIKGISLNRNVPEVLRSLAIKSIKQKELAAKPRFPKRH